MPKIISLHDVLEPLKQALLASRDVIISSQICGSNLQNVFTLGDGCWLPIFPPQWAVSPSALVGPFSLLNLHRANGRGRFGGQTAGIGNGVGKQGRGNQPPYRRYGHDTEIQYRPREPFGLAKTSRILSKREADTEFQYRPHIVDTDTDCGRHFCGRHFRDS